MKKEIFHSFLALFLLFGISLSEIHSSLECSQDPLEERERSEKELEEELEERKSEFGNSNESFYQNRGRLALGLSSGKDPSTSDRPVVSGHVPLFIRYCSLVVYS